MKHVFSGSAFKELRSPHFILISKKLKTEILATLLMSIGEVRSQGKLLSPNWRDSWFPWAEVSEGGRAERMRARWNPQLLEAPCGQLRQFQLPGTADPGIGGGSIVLGVHCWGLYQVLTAKIWGWNHSEMQPSILKGQPTGGVGC